MHRIGEVFTPLKWALWLLNKWQVFDRWVDGASICDPTAGDGALALSLFKEAEIRGIEVTADMLHRLHLIELKKEHLSSFTVTAKRAYGLEMPDTSLRVCDVIMDTPCETYDLLVGNPPWANFTDLPPEYKEELKPYFIGAGLVPDPRAALLGSSRVDIAALVLKTVLGRLLRDGGSAYFFIPLSLVVGDDAHIGFRDYTAFESPFAIKQVFEFCETKIFRGVGTAYGCASFVKGEIQKFPVPYFRESSTGWTRLEARPLSARSDQWRVVDPRKTNGRLDGVRIRLSPDQKPRQGVNTCGANGVYIFDHKPEFLDHKFLFPLATNVVWSVADSATPDKWVFLPYDQRSGRPLGLEAVRDLRGYDYLEESRGQLESRKGTLINSFIKRGIWWALLGIGVYSFAPFKVIWQAYGRSDFDPLILSDFEGQAWQGNQAMHAFIPCWDLADARRILGELNDPNIVSLLRELSGDGRRNWAQPGKMKKIIFSDTPVYEQLQLL